MRNYTTQAFTKGINARLPIERFGGDSQRLHTLQNARITSRGGNTYFVTRIEGATALNEEEYPVVLDIMIYRNFVIVLFKKEENSTFHYVDIVDATNPQVKVIEKPFVYSDINTKDIGKLLLLEDTILISPHNKMLNYIFGAWNFNDFVSTTPTIETNIIDAEGVTEEKSLFLANIIVKSDVLDIVPDPVPSVGVITFVDRLNLPAFGMELKFKPSSDSSVITTTFAFDEGLNTADVCLQIIDTLNAVGNFQTKWVASVFNQTITFTVKPIIVDNSDYAEQYNGLDFSIKLIADRDVLLDLLDLFDVVNEVSCSIPGLATKCAKTFGGRAGGTYGNVLINLGKKDPIPTRNFTVDDDIESITTELMEKLSVLEETGDYQVLVEDGEGDNEGFKVISIGAVNPGLAFNLEPIEIEFPEGFFTGTTKFFDVEVKIVNTGKNIIIGDFDTTKAYWYKARNVYFDGHKTKTCFPVYSKTEKNSDNIELAITPTRDIDGGYADIEIFRKTDEGDFFFIKKITPQDIDATQDYFVVQSEPAYRYIYTRSQNFPVTETKTISFSLGEYTTDIIELTPEDTEISFIQKIYDAFMALESFTSKWNIEISPIPRGIIISSVEISKEYNEIRLIPNDTGETSMLRTPVAGLGVVETTQEDTNQIQIVPQVFPIKLFENDIIVITTLAGSSQLATLSSDYEITETQNLIPIKETLEIVESSSSVAFVSGEVFSDFGLIRSVDVFDPFVRFYDVGFREFYVLDEKEYIWSRHHYTHEVARDRYVRANIDYDLIEDVIPEFQFTLQEVVSLPQDNTSPFFTNGTLFAQARFKDGTTSFFEQIASFSTETESESFSIKQSSIADQNVKEYAFYAEYKPKNNPYIELNAASFSNILLPTEFSSKYKKTEDDKMEYRRSPIYPLNPRFFVGFGRVKVSYITNSEENRYQYDVARTSVFEWILNEEAETEFYTIGGELTEEPMEFPEKKTISYFGLTLDYILEDVTGTSATYILMPLLGMKTLTEKIDLFYEITQFAASSGGFGGVKVDEIINRKYRVLGYDLFKDPSADNDEYDGALFINIESGTPLDKVQAQVTKKALAASGDDEFDYDSHNFNLVIGQAIFTPRHPMISGRLIGMIIEETDIYGIDEKISSGIFLGSKKNEVNDIPVPLRTGYDTDKRFYTFEDREVNVYFSKIQISNIYASIFLETDIPYQKEKYPNQIIWSEPFVLNSNANGYRNIRPEAFLNIGADYGRIVGLEYINNRLLVFTEHGLAIVNVGEVLTQQIGGEVFVDSSSFLNGYSWVLKELPYVMPKTIVQHENAVFFCDGQDVWMYDGQIKNISQGAIRLNGLGFGLGDSTAGVFMGSTDIFWGETNRYMGEDGSPLSGLGQVTTAAWVGAIDPYNKEYRITDSFVTYAYSIEFGEWFGPYTYKDQASSSLKNTMLSVIDKRLAVQNLGAEFVTEPYDTIVESVANSMDRPDMVKLWRKFYIDVSIDDKSPTQYNSNTTEEPLEEGTVNTLGQDRVFFGYRKGLHLSYQDVDLAVAKVRNNCYNIGVVNAHQNSEQLYWRLQTKEPSFVLKLVAFEFMKRDRR